MRPGPPRAALLLFVLGLTLQTLLAADFGQLTRDGTFKRDPKFLNSDRQLTYCVDENRVLIRAMKLNLENGTIAPLFKEANKHQIEPVFAPDGRYLAFTECTGNLTAKLVIRDLEKEAAVEIKHSGRGGTRSPTFTPDSKQVVYAFAETGPQQLWSVDVDGKNKQQLTESEGINNWPSFTPDGKTIVFSSSRDRNYEIYRMNADGSDQKRLTQTASMDIRPALSPDGMRVAFTSNRDGNYEVYVMSANGGEMIRVTHNEERDDYPCWHPNGRQLVIVSERAGHHDLYLIDVPSEADHVARKN